VSITVAIDATYQRQSSGGIPRYGRALVRALKDRKDVNVFEIGGGEFAQRATLRRTALTAGLQLVWYPWLGRRLAERRGANVLHCLLPRGPMTRGRIPFVVTVHDLVPFRFPETMTRWGRWYGRATHRRVLLAADRVIVQSADTADDVVRLLQIPAEKIRIVPMGIDAAFRDPVNGASPIPKPYVLFVGCANPRKNLERLERAVGLLRARGFPHALVLVGEDSWGQVELRQPFTQRLGRVSDDKLRRLYAHADCVALPSLHEGFGFTALEAMAAGTPVVASTAGALPETTGDAAVLVDPYDEKAICEGIERAISDREQLRQRGRDRAALFTWERTAAATLEVYREIV
jgi:glycosyltransferase involved in cell wall biosynthesis